MKKREPLGQGGCNSNMSDLLNFLFFLDLLPINSVSSIRLCYFFFF